MLLAALTLAFTGNPVQSVPVERSRLEDGSELVYRQVAGDAPVLVLLRLRGGEALEPASRPGLADLAAAILSDYGQPEQATFPAWVGEHGGSFAVHASEAELRLELSIGSELVPEALERLGAHLAREDLLEAGLERVRPRVLSELTEHGANSGVRALLTLAELESPTRAPLLWNRSMGLQAATAAEVRAYLAEQRLAARAVVAAAGPWSAAEFASLWRSKLGALEVRPPSTPPRPPASLPIEAGRIRIVNQVRAETTEIRCAGAALAPDDPDAAALALWSSYLMGRFEEALAAGGAPARWVRVGFALEPGETGRFEAALLTPSEEAGRALAWLLALLEGSQKGFEESALEAARARLRRSAGETSAVSARQLLSESSLALHMLPPDLLEHRLERALALTAAELQSAVARHFDPARLRMVAVGPTRTIERQFVLQARPERYEPLVERMLAAIGGRAAWAGLGALEVEITIEAGANMTIPTHQWLDLDRPRYCVEMVLGGAQKRVILDETRALELSGNQATDYGAEKVAELVTRNRRSLWNVLHRMARAEDIEVEETAGGDLRVVGVETVECVLQLGPDGRPARLLYQEGGTTYKMHYKDWKESEGLAWASTVREEPSGRSWHVLHFQPLSDFDPERLKR